jgi:hypothetical protein
MSTEERTAAGKNGYENGLGAMSAKARMAARKKGDKMRMGIAWEEKYAEFESYDGMPEIGTPLYCWQDNQLGNRRFSLNAKIWKEIEENKGSTVWSERRVKLSIVLCKRIARKLVTRGRRSTLSSNHTTGCRREEPRFTWQSNQSRIKGVYGVKGE